MEDKDREYLSHIAEYLKNVDYIKTEEIPGIDLYMDQVTTFMDSQLASFKRFDDDKILTKTMINNYTKADLLPSPNKKKYSKDHMLLLIFIYYFKNVLSISDIDSIMGPLSRNYFKNEESDLSLTEIYDKILNNETDQIINTTKDVLRRHAAVKEMFPEETDPDRKKYLEDFAFISSLNFDICIKKSIIEYLVDNILEKDKADKKEKKEDK